MHLYNVARSYIHIKPNFRTALESDLFYSAWFESHEQIQEYCDKNSIPYERETRYDILAVELTFKEAEKWMEKQRFSAKKRDAIVFQKVEHSPEVSNIIDSMNRFKKFCIGDFYMHKVTRLCKRCDERVRAYTITQHLDERNLDEYKLIAKYCFHCGMKYYAKSDDKNIKEIQALFKEAMKDHKVLIRQRGGARLTEHEILYGQRGNPSPSLLNRAFLGPLPFQTYYQGISTPTRDNIITRAINQLSGNDEHDE